MCATRHTLLCVATYTILCIDAGCVVIPHIHVVCVEIQYMPCGSRYSSTNSMCGGTMLTTRNVRMYLHTVFLLNTWIYVYTRSCGTYIYIHVSIETHWYVHILDICTHTSVYQLRSNIVLEIQYIYMYPETETETEIETETETRQRQRQRQRHDRDRDRDRNRDRDRDRDTTETETETETRQR